VAGGWAMRNFAAVLLLLSALAWAGTDPNPADYTVVIHVSSSRWNGHDPLRLKVVIDGKKYELQAADFLSPLLAPGDYKAKTVEVKVKDVHPYDVYGTYEFLFPDKKTRRFTLIGMSE
jgi:hypothetical protein